MLTSFAKKLSTITAASILVATQALAPIFADTGDTTYIYGSDSSVRYEHLEGTPDCQKAKDGSYLAQLCKVQDNIHFAKTVTPVDGQPGYLDVNLSTFGPYDVSLVQTKAYIVILLDHSGSMVNNGVGKLDQAKDAIITAFGASSDFYANMADNNITPNLAVIGFGDKTTTSKQFDTGSTVVPINYPTHLNPLQRTDDNRYTNLQSALAEGTQLLNAIPDAADTYKYMIVLTDGVPTACRVTSGTNCALTQTSAQNDSLTHIREPGGTDNPDPKFAEAAVAVAGYKGNINIIPVAYDIDGAEAADCNGNAVCLGYAAARDTLTQISDYVGADGKAYLSASTSATELAEALKIAAGQTKILWAGYQAEIFDQIGDAFTVVEGSLSSNAALSTDKRSVTCTIGDITNIEKSCTFRIKLDLPSNVCGYPSTLDWLDTNKYQLANGDTTGTSLKYSETEDGPVSETIAITSNPQYQHTFDPSDFIGCNPGQIDINKLLQTEDGLEISSAEDSTSFNFNVKIVSATDSSIYPYGYKLNNSATSWTPYTASGINITIQNGENFTIYLEEISSTAGAYKAIVTETTPTEPYYCLGENCVGAYFAVTNDTAVDYTAVNIYALPQPGSFQITKTVEDDVQNSYYGKTFDQDLEYKFDIAITCKTDLPYGAECSHDAPSSVLLKHGESSDEYTYTDLRGIESIVVTEDESYLAPGYTFNSRDNYDFVNLYSYTPVPGQIALGKDIITDPKHSALFDHSQSFEFEIKVSANDGSIIRYRTAQDDSYQEVTGGIIRITVKAGQTITIDFEDTADITSLDITEIDNPNDAWHLANISDPMADNTNPLFGGSNINTWTFTNQFLPTCTTHPLMDECIPDAPLYPNTGFAPLTPTAATTSTARTTNFLTPLIAIITTTTILLITRKKQTTK